MELPLSSEMFVSLWGAEDLYELNSNSEADAADSYSRSTAASSSAANTDSTDEA